jgi:hypothetical protein
VTCESAGFDRPNSSEDRVDRRGDSGGIGRIVGHEHANEDHAAQKVEDQLDG